MKGQWLKERERLGQAVLSYSEDMAAIPTDPAKSKRRPHAVLYGYQLLLFVAVALQSPTTIHHL
jgi:hypothetical protein